MTTRLILASASPRRRELLAMLGLPFEVIPGKFDEEQVMTVGLSPSEYVLNLAEGKAADVAAQVTADALVIGADTTVVLDGDYLNKPRDAAEAHRMLRRLSGRTHQVYTGLCLLSVIDGAVTNRISDYSVTDVTFDEISDETIVRYIASGEPQDKAGAYGIQGKALTFLSGIKGDYFNVVGLPLERLRSLLLPDFPEIASAPPHPEKNKKRKTNMEIKRNGSRPSGKGPDDWFTGTVRIDPLFQAEAPARTAAALVTFEPGARTAWHTHPLGQNLIVTAGLGWVQRAGGPVEEIRPGDVVWFPPGEKHWHGATATTAVMHIAIQESLDSKAVDWLEKVTDEQFHARQPQE